PVSPQAGPVQKRAQRINAKAVDVELLEPAERVAEKKRANLVAGVVEDERAPRLVLALPRIGVLVDRCAVEVREAMAVFGKMPWHPVEDHAQAVAVALVHEVAEIVGRAEAAR